MNNPNIEYFFENPNKTVIAVDKSGSTSCNNTLENEKMTVKNIMIKNQHKNEFLKNIYGWASDCEIEHLNNLFSGGGTYPSSIFPLSSNYENILLTSDGEVEDEEIKATKRKIEENKKNKQLILGF